NALPWHQFQTAGAVSDIGLAVGDALGFRTRRGAEDDHAGTESIAGVVEKGACAHQQAPGLKVMNELMVAPGELFLAERNFWRWVDDFVVDHPTLLALAHCCVPSRSKTGRTAP